MCMRLETFRCNISTTLKPRLHTDFDPGQASILCAIAELKEALKITRVIFDSTRGGGSDSAYNPGSI